MKEKVERLQLQKQKKHKPQSDKQINPESIPKINSESSNDHNVNSEPDIIDVETESTIGNSNPKTSSPNNFMAELERLIKMKNDGYITDEEFEDFKTQLRNS